MTNFGWYDYDTPNEPPTLDRLISKQPCPRCARWVGHFDWCPASFRSDICICQTSVVPPHHYGDNPRCLYVGDWQDPDREWRGIMWTQKQLQGVEKCHWPNPV